MSVSISVTIKSRQSRAVAWIVLAGLTVAHAGAATPALGDELQVTIDEAMLMRLDAPVADVIIGNPSVADVAVQSSRILVFTGKSFGSTNVIVLDAQGHEIANRRLRVNADGRQAVTLHKGIARQSYACNPDCRAALVPGDDHTYFNDVARTTRGKFGVAQSVLDENAGAPQ